MTNTKDEVEEVQLSDDDHTNLKAKQVCGAIGLSDNYSTIWMSYTELEKLYLWYKSFNGYGIRWGSHWFMEESQCSTRNAQKAHKFATIEEATKVLKTLNEGWQESAIIVMIPKEEKI